MVANIRGYTPNYGFKLINFDTPRWHTLEYSNWNMVDGILLAGGVPSMRGAWQNNTLYLIGERVFDEDTSAIYRCLVEHTSAVGGTFAADRTANPTYWSLQLAGTPVFRGEWLSGAVYVLGDIVSVDDYTFYIAVTPSHTAGATFPPDAINWQQVFDAAQVVADAEAAAASAFGHANAAAASAAAAASSETDAQTAEDSAESWANDARAAAGGFRWAFSSDTAAIDPAAGRIAFNNAVPASVTEIYLSALSGEAGNPDVSAWITTWDDSTNPLTRGTLQLRKVGAPEEFMIFELTGSIVDNGSWLKLDVSYISHSGSLINGEPLSVGFVRAGNVGPTGTGGGDMLRSNNLNDVVSIPTSRNNLGLGIAQIPTFSQVLLDAAVTANKHAATKEYVDASPALYVSDTAPVGVQDGSLWWDSDRGTLLVRYNDGDSTQWVDAVAVPGLDTSQLATKAYVDAADAVLNTAKVAKAGDTMTGELQIAPAGNATIKLTKAASGNFNGIVGWTLNQPRWQIQLGNGDAESSGALGSNFSIDRFNDGGVYIGSGLEINRATGDAVLGNSLSLPGVISWLGSGAGAYLSSDGVHHNNVMASNAYWQYAKASGLYNFVLNSAQKAYFDVGGNILVTGTGFKPGGGAWADGSDARIKNVVGDFTRGLTEIAHLRPVYYTFKGNDTPTAPAHFRAPHEIETREAPTVAPYPNSPHRQAALDAKQFAGLIAQETEAVFPEMVTQRTAFIDGVEVNDLRDIDTTPLIFALINAVKELKERIEVLEAV